MQMPTPASYTLKRATKLPFDHAADRVRHELAAEGFGIPTEINVQALLHEKLGTNREPYLILGACIPTLADQALTTEPDLGTLLPCNIAIYQTNGHTHIAAIDPTQMLSIVNNDTLTPLANQIRKKLAAVVRRASGS
jgi:uncharacterized protein (DUF302 family)